MSGAGMYGMMILQNELLSLYEAAERQESMEKHKAKRTSKLTRRNFLKGSAAVTAGWWFIGRTEPPAPPRDQIEVSLPLTPS